MMVNQNKVWNGKMTGIENPWQTDQPLVPLPREEIYDRQEQRRQRLAETWERIHQRQMPEAAKNITAEKIKTWINDGRE